MNQRRVSLPDGMLRAVEKVHEYKFTPDSVIRTLQAALGWFEKEIESRKQANVTLWQAGYNAAIEDIRGIFTAEEREPMKVVVPGPGVYRIGVDGLVTAKTGEPDEH